MQWDLLRPGVLLGLLLLVITAPTHTTIELPRTDITPGFINYRLRCTVLCNILRNLETNFDPSDTRLCLSEELNYIKESLGGLQTYVSVACSRMENLFALHPRVLIIPSGIICQRLTGRLEVADQQIPTVLCLIKNRKLCSCILPRRLVVHEMCSYHSHHIQLSDSWNMPYQWYMHVLTMIAMHALAYASIHL